jgi:hypothetical protein
MIRQPTGTLHPLDFFDVWGAAALDLAGGGLDFFELCGGIDLFEVCGGSYLIAGLGWMGGDGLGFLNVGAALGLAGAGGLAFFNMAGALDVIGEVGAR